MQKFFQNLGNRILKPLLKSRFHGIISKNLMLITFTGRKSGKIYTTPVQYRRDGERVTMFSQKHRIWWKNLQGGAPVSLRIQGHNYTGTATAYPDASESEIHAELKKMSPNASKQQIANFLPKLVLIRIQL